MDAVGLSDVSFASLLPLTLIFWAMQRLPRKSMGIALGRWRHYGLAILHPVVIIGALGVKQTALYGPESGFWGLGLNLLLAIALLHWWKRRKANTTLP